MTTRKRIKPKNKTENKLEKAKTAKTNKPTIQANKRKPTKTRTKRQKKTYEI